MKWLLLSLLPLASGCVVEDLVELRANIETVQALVNDLTALLQALLVAGEI